MVKTLLVITGRRPHCLASQHIQAGGVKVGDDNLIEGLHVEVNGVELAFAARTYGKIHPKTRNGPFFTAYFELAVDIPDNAKNVRLSYVLINQAHPSAEQTRETLRAFNAHVPVHFLKGARHPGVEVAQAGLQFVPAGNAIATLAKAFAGGLFAQIFRNCDGPVAYDSFVVPDWLNVGNGPVITSKTRSVGMTNNSDYEVHFHVIKDFNGWGN
ncbi:hypothetical protein MNV49_005454 [Pseudohyphozyma bogoriensis]|nr:hypothetical protein MNV49_005454 [Pseudohyphozyma bogoriensis]